MTALDTAIDLLYRGFWPVPITSPASADPNVFAPGKQPIGRQWGIKKHTPETLRKVYAAHPDAGVGLKLGPLGGVVDLDVDEPELAKPVLERMFAGEEPETLGFTSTRGRHWLFLWDSRLAKYGKALVQKHPHYPGLEIRLGWSAEGKQYQTVVPPSVGDDGQPRRWSNALEVGPLPEAFFVDLDLYLAAPKSGGFGTRPVLDARPVLVWDAEQRAIAYLRKCGPSISGQKGHSAAFKAACKVGPGFDLLPETALRLLRDHYNPTCQPPWSERELQHKVEDAYKVETRRGWFLDAPDPTPTVEADPDEAADPDAPRPPAETFDDPFRLARTFLKERCAPDGFPTLIHWLEEWHQWDGSRYRVVPESELRAAALAHCKAEFDAEAKTSGRAPAKVTRAAVANVMGAMACLAILPRDECPDRPAWLEDAGEDQPDPIDVVPARNGLIHLPALVEGRHGLLPPTPRFFSPNCLGFHFDPQAPRPDHWLTFLKSLWEEEPDSIASLQEWFGYLLTPDTSQQKMLVIIGPPRSGKGTIARALTALLGDANVVSPTLSSMTNEFRVAPLIGRTLAIFSDARLNGRSDVPIIVERLLSISGEDSQTIDRKNKESWSGKLHTRFVLMANELPQLTDASRAVTSRTVILRLTRSFLGQEDRGLQSKLEAELPSVLLWSIAGWARLKRRGYFLQPASGEVLVKEMDELSSPVSSFIEDCCEVDPLQDVPTSELYDAWKEWCKGNGRDHPGPITTFGRYLRASLPTVETIQKRVEGKQVRFFVGLRLGSDSAF